MYCKYCGNEIKEGKFCSNCGKNIDEKIINKEEVNYNCNDEINSNNVNNGLTFKERYWLEAYRDNYAFTRNTIKRKGIKIYKNYKLNTGVKNPSKIVAGILAIIFGNLGIHRFYLGYYLYGATYLVLTLICAILGFDKLIFTLCCLSWIDAYRIFTGKLKNVDGKELK